MQHLENNACKLPDRTREIQSIVRRFSCGRDKLQRRIQQTLEYGDEGMSLSHEFADSPQFYLQWVYKRLPPDRQETFQQATLSILDSVVAHPDTSMSANASDDLLLMMQEIFKSNASARARAIQDLKTIIANDKTLAIQTQVTAERTVSLHARAVQMLVGFNSKEPVSFWNHLVEIYGDTYAPMASQGVFNLDFDIGVQWLLDHKNLPEVLTAFIQCMPYYYETKFGMDRCDKAIDTISSQVPSEYTRRLRATQKSVKKWLEREAQLKGGE